MSPALFVAPWIAGRLLAVPMLMAPLVGAALSPVYSSAPSAVAAAAGTTPDEPPETPDGTTAEASAALDAAKKLKSASRGTTGPERLELLRRAATAYEDVATRFPSVAAVGSEAWFRAGEIHRTIRSVEDAERCFVAATQVPGAAEFGARSTLELGHLARRTDEWKVASEHYARVRSVYPEQRKYGVQARTWEGKSLLQTGETKAGHDALLSVGQLYPEFPVDDVRNVDAVAMDWARNGRPADARRLVRECLARHSTPAEGEEKVADNVKKALVKMKSREYLGVQDDSRPTS